MANPILDDQIKPLPVGGSVYLTVGSSDRIKKLQDMVKNFGQATLSGFMTKAIRSNGKLQLVVFRYM